MWSYQNCYTFKDVIIILFIRKVHTSQHNHENIMAHDVFMIITELSVIEC